MTGEPATRVTFLGTGTSVGVPVPTCNCRVCSSDDPRDTRLRPSVLLQWGEASVLIDSSPDLRAQALRHRIRRVDAVLYTHSHADHILGLDDLRLYNWKQGSPIPAYGNRETLDALRRTFWYVFEGEPTQSTRPAIEPRLVDSTFTLQGRTVVPLPLLHGPLSILGYRVGAFAYLTDVSEIPETCYPLLQDLDVLVLDALRERPHPMHLSLDEAVQLARRIAARRTFFTHMTHEVHHATVSGRLPRDIDLAHDGLSLIVPGATDGAS